jgi:hypothetical protein
MIDVAILQAVGFMALGLLVLGWLIVSFQSPGRRQLTSARGGGDVPRPRVPVHALVQENWERAARRYLLSALARHLRRGLRLTS